MAQRLVLKAHEGRIQLQDFQNFVDRAKELDFGWRQEITVEKDEDGYFFFGLPIPEKHAVRANGRRVVRRVKTRKEAAVEKQIEEHKEKVKNHEEVPGYVPPVEKKKPVKKACPVCGWRKDVVTNGGVKRIKQHTRNGKTCAGSNTVVSRK